MKHEYKHATIMDGTNFRALFIFQHERKVRLVLHIYLILLLAMQMQRYYRFQHFESSQTER